MRANNRETRVMASQKLRARLLSEEPKVFLGRGEQNYFHWFLEEWPKFIVAQKLHGQVSVILPRDIPSFALREIETYLPPERCIMVPNHTLPVKNLILFSGEPWRSPGPQVIRAVADFYITAGDGRKTNERIYVTRLGSRRSFLGEKIVEDALEHLGFRIFRPPDFLDVRQAAETFHSAEIILGPYGAGLTNICFAKPRTKVLEIDCDGFWDSHFAHVSNTIDLDHFIFRLRGLEGDVARDAIAQVVSELLLRE